MKKSPRYISKEKDAKYITAILVIYGNYSGGQQDSFTSYFKHFCTICSHI